MINLSRLCLVISIIFGILTISLNENSDVFGVVITIFAISLIICTIVFMNLSIEEINKVLMIDFFKKIGIDIEND